MDCKKCLKISIMVLIVLTMPCYSARATMNYEFSFNSTALSIFEANAPTMFIDQGCIYDIGPVSSLRAKPSQLACPAGLTDGASSGINNCVVSDETLKTNIANISFSTLSVIDRLSVKNYQWKNHQIRDNLTHLGLIAQEVEKVFPQAVIDAGLDENSNRVKGIDISAMTALLIKSVQELAKKMELLEADTAKNKKENLGLILSETSSNSTLGIVGSANITGNLEVGSGLNVSNDLRVITGNVGIGIASPTQKLDVSGNINITANNVTHVNCIVGANGGKICFGGS